jgi:hypothetical protein
VFFILVIYNVRRKKAPHFIACTEDVAVAGSKGGDMGDPYL